MPDWNSALTSRLRPLSLTPAREREIIEELSQHLDDRYRELRSAGSPHEQAFQETARQMKDLKAMLDQPLMNALMAFIEPFPIGVIVALVSAAVLRTKSGAVRRAELARGR